MLGACLWYLWTYLCSFSRSTQTSGVRKRGARARRRWGNHAHFKKVWLLWKEFRKDIYYTSAWVVVVVVVVMMMLSSRLYLVIASGPVMTLSSSPHSPTLYPSLTITQHQPSRHSPTWHPPGHLFISSAPTYPPPDTPIHSGPSIPAESHLKKAAFQATYLLPSCGVLGVLDFVQSDAEVSRFGNSSMMWS